MKVAVFGVKSSPAFAGVDRVVERLIEHTSPGISYTVYITRTRQNYGIPREGTRYIRIPTLSGKHSKPFAYYALCTLHYLWKGRYDVLHIHDSSTGFFAPLLKLKPGTHIVGTFHGNPYDDGKWGAFAKWYLRLSEKIFVRYCDLLTSVARTKVDELRTSGGTTVEYIPNGVDAPGATTSRGSGFYEKWGIRRKGYILFACGRLDATKGLHHLLKAFAKAALGMPLVVVGNFTHDRQYTATIERMCTGSDVRLCKELLSREEFLDVLANATLLVFPSEVEGMAMVLLEAISVRACILCSNIPQNVDVVGPDYPYLFDLGKDGDLLAKMAAAMNDARLQQTADILHQQCVKRFGWRAIAESYASCYRRTANNADRSTDIPESDTRRTWQ